MSYESPQPEPNGAHGSYEHSDLRAAGIFYFLLGLAVATMVAMLALGGVYDFLDRRERASQPALNPLVTNVPEDTRHIAPGYPQRVFPDPKLEENERGQLYGYRLQQEEALYSYGWVDEKAGTVRLPIERAMDLLVQRGLPVRAQGSGSGAATVSAAMNTKAEEKQ
ncbi:MAG: hypothetical protein ABSF59_13585 [Candidatus Sulfotelmatobacter sp.]|jgi:hypothetical protein